MALALILKLYYILKFKIVSHPGSSKWRKNNNNCEFVSKRVCILYDNHLQTLFLFFILNS